MSHKSKVFVPVMLTPFRENGEVDFDGLTKLTEFYLEAGAGGLFANCQSSEMFSLSDQERLAVTEHVIKVAAGAVPVVAAGTFEGTTEQQADFVKRMHDTGTDAVITITGMIVDESASDEAFNDHFYKLLDLTAGIPLGFYECPLPYKRLLSSNQIKDFVDTGRIIYYKDTCLDINLIKSRLEATKHVPSFGLYDAYMAHAVESLKAGSAGLSCIQGNYFPELIVWLCNNYDDSSKAEEVARVQQFFIDNMDVMHTVYPVVAKYFLQKRGLNMSRFTRNKVGDFNNDVRAAIDKLFNDYTELFQAVELTPVT
ncbi:MAG: dihydrodipicolinate synthase family protein [Chitinophagaceae bacterium]|nr:dihydrodipicolinate synthase family protein [Chitinophagaceae bacterium]